jgi:hypothetical protein
MYNRVSIIRHLRVLVTTSIIMSKQALLRKEEFVMEMFNYNKTPRHHIVKELKMFILLQVLLEMHGHMDYQRSKMDSFL